MQQILKNIIAIIGLAKLLNYVWEIAFDELNKLATDSEAAWDDKAVKVLDEIVKGVIKSLEVKS
ncbi:MAG: hypothetical protein IPH62_15315 [Ignavibacteriae bacterium]|nr:hypothetical protein [Ignavibacteriota bacterium]